MEVITEEELCKGLESRIWLCSHGGVSSEALTRALGIKYPKIKSSTSKRPFIGCAAHFPYPPKTGPKACIYIFGDIVNSILSQIRRGHYDNPIKIMNNEKYPKIHNLKELLKIESSDPYGIRRQINSFHHYKTDYPIALLKYPFTAEALNNLQDTLDLKLDKSFEIRKRTTLYTHFDQKDVELLQEIYESLQNEVDLLPNFRYRLPSNC